MSVIACVGCNDQRVPRLTGKVRRRSGGTRRSTKLRATVVDGFKFASAPEAQRYENLKGFAGPSFTVLLSADRVVVCQWATRLGKHTQAFALAGKKKQKYNAVPTLVGDILFASGSEARRYVELTHLQAAGEIRDLVHHPPSFELEFNGVKIGKYTPDFTYTVVATGAKVIEERKSSATKKARDYPLRKKLMKACHGIDLFETYARGAR